MHYLIEFPEHLGERGIIADEETEAQRGKWVSPQKHHLSSEDPQLQDNDILPSNDLVWLQPLSTSGPKPLVAGSGPCPCTLVMPKAFCPADVTAVPAREIPEETASRPGGDSWVKSTQAQQREDGAAEGSGKQGGELGSPTPRPGVSGVRPLGRSVALSAQPWAPAQLQPLPSCSDLVPGSPAEPPAHTQDSLCPAFPGSVAGAGVIHEQRKCS